MKTSVFLAIVSALSLSFISGMMSATPHKAAQEELIHSAADLGYTCAAVGLTRESMHEHVQHAIEDSKETK